MGGRLFCTRKYCRVLKVPAVGVVIFCSVMALTWATLRLRLPEIAQYSGPIYESFVSTLSRRAIADGYIILAMVDEAFTDMAANLFEYSFARNHIDNFLFVGVGNVTCNVLTSLAIPCFHFADDPNSLTASSYGNPDFIRKMNIRTDMILYALAANFTVVHTDTDVAFLTNPLDHIKSAMMWSDMAALWDHTVYNAGFIVIKPTRLSRLVYQKIQLITNESEKTDDQQALNQAIATMTKDGLNATVLDRSRYVNGRDYFETPNRLFPSADDGLNQTDSAIVVHNNWIVSREAKVYRFREHLMWLYDDEAGYYSSPTRRYLTYRNPAPPLAETNSKLADTKQMELTKKQLLSLRTVLAIGHLLNRSVILPRFHCSVTDDANKINIVECPLNSLVHMPTFDAEFSQLYRESSFLRHPKVPAVIRRGVSALQQVLNIAAGRSSAADVSSEDIRRLYGGMTDAVLYLDSLHGISVNFHNESVGLAFAAKVRGGFRLSDYRQLEPSKFLYS